MVLMGKNTMMKRSIRLYVEETGDEKWSPLVEQLVGNVGLIFTKADLSDVREQIEGFKVRSGCPLFVVMKGWYRRRAAASAALACGYSFLPELTDCLVLQSTLAFRRAPHHKLCTTPAAWRSRCTVLWCGSAPNSRGWLPICLPVACLRGGVGAPVWATLQCALPGV